MKYDDHVRVIIVAMSSWNVMMTRKLIFQLYDLEYDDTPELV